MNKFDDLLKSLKQVIDLTEDQTLIDNFVYELSGPSNDFFYSFLLGKCKTSVEISVPDECIHSELPVDLILFEALEEHFERVSYPETMNVIKVSFVSRDQPYKKITYIYSFIEDILIRQFKLGNSLYLKYKKNQSIGERFDIINSDTLHYFT
jgi:hypothetical protein